MTNANKKSRKANAEILERGQGKRLQEFFIAKDFKSRNAFAKAIGVSSSSINEVIWGFKLISGNLLSRIKRKYPRINEEWLLNGSTADLPEINVSLAEDQEDYKQDDKHKEDFRDMLIRQQSDLIDQQLATIDQLLKQIKLLKEGGK